MRVLTFSLSVLLVYFGSTQCWSQAHGDATGIASGVSEPIPLAVFNSASDDYAPAFDPRMQRVTITSERSGVAAIYGGLVDQDSSIVPIAGTFNQTGQQRSFVRYKQNGDGIGIAYHLTPTQSFPGIWSVTRDDGQLNIGHGIDALNGSFFVSHPTISLDGSRIIFCSDRVGGLGQLDLWTSERNEDLSWNAPTPMRNTINSEANEISPYLISSDTLIFASNGIGGKGGYDIFMSVYRNGAWQEPLPLDWLNSEFDDSDCMILPDGDQVFASNRPGGKGGLDIWIARKRK